MLIQFATTEQMTLLGITAKVEPGLTFLLDSPSLPWESF